MAKDPFSRYLHKSPEIASTLDTLRMVSMTGAPVLLQGATGTGKTLLAELIHEQALQGRLMTISCAQLTSASLDQLMCDISGSTTLFLDDIDTLPAELQGSLLDVIENQVWLSPSSSKRCKLDIRVIAASNQLISQLVDQGNFRADLYYRLSIINVTLPALEQRTEDIPLLVRHFAEEAAAEYSNHPVQFSAAALMVLKRYRWPGNIRELRNVCQRLALLVPGRVIEPANLPDEIRQDAEKPQHGALDLAMQEVETIRRALSQAAGNKSKAARILGISRDTLNYRLKKYELS